MTTTREGSTFGEQLRFEDTEPSFGPPEKPPYEIPSVETIKRDLQGRRGLTLVSTFSGAGGSSLGFRMAGYDVLWASEFIEAARDTYLANFPDTPVDDRDIREVSWRDILEATGLARGELDCLEGSPPCASWSVSNIKDREKGWGKTRKYSETEQVVDDLFGEFTRLLQGLQPKTFVAENVPGLLMGGAENEFRAIYGALRAAGYVVGARVLNAWDFGAPQRRHRLIFIGVRKDLGAFPAYPRPLPYRYHLGDALPSLRGAEGALRPSEAEKREASIAEYAIGDAWENIGPGDKSEKYYNLERTDPGAPCPVVTQTGGRISAASVTHPYEKRKFTTGELKRICGFPDDFRVTGDYQQRWERLGRAVPPPMARAIAEALRDEILT